MAAITFNSKILKLGGGVVSTEQVPASLSEFKPAIWYDSSTGRTFMTNYATLLSLTSSPEIGLVVKHPNRQQPTHKVPAWRGNYQNDTGYRINWNSWQNSFESLNKRYGLDMDPATGEIIGLPEILSVYQCGQHRKRRAYESKSSQGGTWEARIYDYLGIAVINSSDEMSKMSVNTFAISTIAGVKSFGSGYTYDTFQKISDL